MRTRVWGWLPLLLALPLLSLACGDGGEKRDLEEYFQEIEGIADDYLAVFNGLQDLYEQTVTSSATDEVKVRAFFSFSEASARNIRDEVDARNRVDPPSGVERAHLEWLAAARVLAKVFEDVVERVPDVQSSLDLQEALEELDYESRLTEAEGRARQACSRLQEIADENEIDVSLCPS